MRTFDFVDFVVDQRNQMFIEVQFCINRVICHEFMYSWKYEFHLIYEKWYPWILMTRQYTKSRIYAVVYYISPIPFQQDVCNWFILSRESNEIEEIKLFTSDIFHIHPFTIMKQNLMKQVTSTEIMAKLIYCLFKVF